MKEIYKANSHQTQKLRTTKEISQIRMLQLTNIKESNPNTSLILLTAAQRERESEPFLQIEFAITLLIQEL